MSLSIWKAIGEFVLLAKDDGKSKSGLIIDAPYTVTSIGADVPTGLTEGIVVALCDDTVLTHLDPSNPKSPYVVHHRNICAASLDGGDEVPIIHMRGF